VRISPMATKSYCCDIYKKYTIAISGEMRWVGRQRTGSLVISPPRLLRMFCQVPNPATWWYARHDMTITLPVTKRDETKTARELRANGNVPAVVYGPKQPTLKVVVEAKILEKVLKQAGESTVIELDGLESKVEVLVKDMEFDPVKQQLIHVDLYAIERGKEMTTPVHFAFTGDAPAEVEGVGNVTKVMHEVSVTCKPADLPNHLDVDLSGLTAVGDRVLIKDIAAPAGVVFEADPEEVVAVVSAAHQEDEEASAPVDIDAIEVEKKGKDEEAS
jgi:large subunit ribosomal protein L25